MLGTSPESIDLAEDRERWNALCARLEIPQPAGGTATTLEQAQEIVEKIGYPVLMRPSYVLGGRAMEIVYDDESLKRAMDQLAGFGSLGKEGGLSAERPVLVDRFLEDATEVDVDAIRDVTGEVIIGGVMEHVEEAGVHSGDSACALPPYSLSPETIAVIEGHTRAIATELEVVGLINVQYAVKANQVFVIEANPRASRTVPFVAKATGVPLVKVAARTMVGATLAELREEGLLCPPSPGGYVAIKEAVLPFNRFPDADSVLGPEMRSTGEVMGIDTTFGLAFAKSQLAAGDRLPESGCVFMSLADRDKATGIEAARRFHKAGFTIAATAGTADALEAARHPRGDPRGQGRGGHRHRRRRADRVRPGAGRRQQPARPRRPRRRRPHPRRGRGAGHPVPHDRGRRAGGRQRHPRPRRPRAAPCARSRSSTPASTATTRSCRSNDARRRRDVDLTTTVGSVTLPNPILTASGTVGPRRRAGALRRPRLARRGRREVAVGASRGRATRRCACTRPPAG